MTTKIVDFPLEKGRIKAPKWLGDAAKTELERIAPLPQEAKTLTQADLTSLAQYCALHGDIVGMRKRRVEVPASMYSQLRGFQADFSLNPKFRLTSTQKTASNNRFSGRGCKRKNK